MMTLIKRKHYPVILSGFLVLALLLDMWPAWVHYSSLQQSQKELTQKLVTIKKFTKRTDKKPEQPNVNQVDMLTVISQVVHASGLTLNSAMPLESDMVKMVVQGSYWQWSAFMTLLAKQAMPLLVTDFSSQLVASNQIKANIDILALKLPDYHASTISMPITNVAEFNPFCRTDRGYLENTSNQIAELTLYPLTQLKMVGFLQQADRRQAVILLPNNAMHLIAPTAIVGKEQGVVTAIQSDRVTIKLPNKSIVVLKE